MDRYQFLASVFQSIASLAWPAAIFGSVYLFREKLKELLPLLRMKYKDLDVSFSDRLDKAEEEAAALPPAPDVPQLEPTPEEKSRFEQIVAVSPRAAIGEIRAELEEALRVVAAQHNLSTEKTSMLSLMRLLRNKGVIDRGTSALLDDLRTIGNEAVHGTRETFTEEDARRTRLLADEVIKRLQQM